MSNDRGKLEEQVRRAEKAKAILNNELVKNYFDKKRNTIMHNLETAHWSNKDEQEELIRMLRLLGDFERDFQKYIAEGENAKTKLFKFFKGD